MVYTLTVYSVGQGSLRDENKCNWEGYSARYKILSVLMNLISLIEQLTVLSVTF